MEKTLSLGAFEELNEREVMETEGGVGVGFLCGAAVAFAGVFCYIAKTVGNMNEITLALNDLDRGESTNVSCKDILGRSYDVTVTGGTNINDYYGDASRLFR